ncbi:MAG: carbamoyl-phosphate synthase large subunit, partial [Deltaproteobacteria bacterium]|nr:carbamoyl-phosphate synthase large subunit [Deltaproteobacteria bacterium]
VHTGDSITVAPAQTLTDKEYQRMRDAAGAIIRAIGMDTGGSNIQNAVNPANRHMVDIDINPRVSSSTPLASNATGYPIAKVAAKLAVGYTLDELPNDITRETRAAFEPTIDYVVTKIPRFAFEKFPHADRTLTTQMKSVGEVMAIGRTFTESLGKAVRSLEQSRDGLEARERSAKKAVEEGIRVPTPERLWWIAEGLRRGWSVARLHALSGIDPWFLGQLARILACEERLAEIPDDAALLLEAKQLGFSDASIARAIGRSPAEVGTLRRSLGIVPTYRMVDTCAAEFVAHTPYLYSTYDGAFPGGTYPSLLGAAPPVSEALPSPRPKVIILGSGPNRIGQGIEFDYCCVQAVFAARAAGYEAIMVNCNPETVSTDYDIADRLYFDPLTFEDVLHIIERERPIGVMIQFGGQTPLKLAKALAAAGVTILGTGSEAIDRAEDRALFSALLHDLGLNQAPAGLARDVAEARAVAERMGYPLIIRPSYVLGGRAMEIVYDMSQLERYLAAAAAASPDHPLLIDRFLANAIEVDVDAVADGRDVLVVGVMEHVEEAGIHSGDSSCCLPPHSLPSETIAEIERQTVLLAKALCVVGLINVQFAVQQGTVYVLEVNPRASRTVPFVAKAIGIPVARIAAHLMLGSSCAQFAAQLAQAQVRCRARSLFAVKTPVFPFTKFPGVDTLLGPEMKSTGEVMGIAEDFGAAFGKAQIAAGNVLPSRGEVFLSVRDEDKPGIVSIAQGLQALGFQLSATVGTAAYLARHDIDVATVRKITDGSPHVVDGLQEGRYVLVINTTAPERKIIADSLAIRRTTIERGITYFTTLAAAQAAIRAMQVLHDGPLAVRPLQDWHGEPTAAVATSRRPGASKPKTARTRSRRIAL